MRTQSTTANKNYLEDLKPDPEIQVTATNPLIITTQAGLEQALAKAFAACGINALLPPEREPVATEMPTRLARKFLMDELRHRVTSDPAFNALIKEYKIPFRKRGKENWYKVADLRRIPPR